MPSDVDEEDPTCICKRELANIFLLECDQCEKFWHTTCCGLTGLTQAPINKLIANHWKCPRCFKFPDEVPPATQEPTQAKVNLDEVTINNIISLVNTTVMKSLKTLLPSEDSDDSDAEDFDM